MFKLVMLSRADRGACLPRAHFFLVLFEDMNLVYRITDLTPQKRFFP